jgi:23S rRNA pseudouridine2457 synthase
MITKPSSFTTKYIKFNKPYGVLCAFTDPSGRSTLADFINVPEVYAAGRLDLDSEGLVFLTNDGTVNHRITSPKYHLSKTYFVQVEGIPDNEALSQLNRGVMIKGNYLTKRCEVMIIPEPDLSERSKPVTPHGPTTWLRIVLREGKKRQVRQMTAAVGLPTLRLFRAAIGPIHIGNLQPGEWAFLDKTEIEFLKKELGL